MRVEARDLVSLLGALGVLGLAVVVLPSSGAPPGAPRAAWSWRVAVPGLSAAPSAASPSAPRPPPPHRVDVVEPLPAVTEPGAERPIGTAGGAVEGLNPARGNRELERALSELERGGAQADALLGGDPESIGRKRALLRDLREALPGVGGIATDAERRRVEERLTRVRGHLERACGQGQEEACITAETLRAKGL